MFSNQSSRIVTESGAFTMTSNDAFVGLDRTLDLASSSTELPPDTTDGQTYTIQDLALNFRDHPVTVNFPSDQLGPGGRKSVALNVNGQSASFTYYGSNRWGVAL
jgi:hypothetical protein